MRISAEQIKDNWTDLVEVINSSFSWVAAFLSPTAKVYSPVLTERKTYMGSNDEVMFDFVEGNEPHWMNLKGSHCESIEIH